jgi:DNA-binding ferritin-like protein
VLDVTPLLTAVDRFADRLRAMPQSALARGAAAEGLALARELAARAQRLEFPGRTPHRLPDAGLFAVGDQLAVAGHDLAEALRTAGGRAGAGTRELAEAVALVEAAESAALRARR